MSGTEESVSYAPARLRVVAGLHLALGVLLLAGIWGGLPARWWPVDGPGTALALLLFATGGGLFATRRWAIRVARAVSLGTLVIGVLLATALALTAAQLAGLYGPVGRGGAMLLATIALLVLPYLVGVPAIQLFLLRRTP